MTIEMAREAYMAKMMTYPKCSFINKKGIQCKFRCPNFNPDEDLVVMCALHKYSSIYYMKILVNLYRLKNYMLELFYEYKYLILMILYQIK